MAPPDWEKWLEAAEKNCKALERMEKRIDDIHETLYKNGLATKVHTLWEWRNDINKIIIGIITAILVVIIGYFIVQPGSSQIEKKLDQIEHRLDNMK